MSNVSAATSILPDSGVSAISSPVIATAVPSAASATRRIVTPAPCGTSSMSPRSVRPPLATSTFFSTISSTDTISTGGVLSPVDGPGVGSSAPRLGSGSASLAPSMRTSACSMRRDRSARRPVPTCTVPSSMRAGLPMVTLVRSSVTRG